MSASKLLKLTADSCEDGNSVESWSASCCECSAAAAAAAARQQRDFTNPSALHPAFLGRWVSRHSSMAITASTVHLQGDSPCLIERLAPYCFMVEHKWGASMMTLLHSLNQVMQILLFY